jgi:hypothetical protein
LWLRVVVEVVQGVVVVAAQVASEQEPVFL